MTEVAIHVAPLEPTLVEELCALALVVFGTIDRDDMLWRIERMPEVTLWVARDGTTMVGFKLGYAVTQRRYHSWLGGVREDHRRQGIASRLMDAQHTWAREHGYTDVDTGAVPDNAAMIALNLRHGFRVIGTYDRPGSGQRVLMLKRLAE